MRYTKIMLILKDRLLNVPIMSLQTGGEIARTAAPIIDPRQLKIVAFYCEGHHLDVKPAILHTEDIREIADVGFIVDSADDIMAPTDLVRLQNILDFHFELVGKQVVEENGRKLGKVIDYTLDNQSFYIIKLHVKPGMMQAWKTTELIIGRTQIREIDETKIIVKSATNKAVQPLKSMQRIVDNPFRSHPQPEASSVEEPRR